MMKFNIKLIENYLKQENISKIEFCKRCGITNQFLQSIYDNKTKVSLLKVVKILKMLNVNFENFIIK